MFNVIEQPAWLQTLSEDAKRRLSRNNQKLVNGIPDVIVSPAMEDIDDESIKEFVRDTFGSGEYTEYLIGIEEANLGKLGPRSIAKPWAERRSDLEAYFTDIPLIERDQFLELARTYRKRFSIDTRLRPVTTEQAVDNLEASSAGGLPFMRKKGDLRKEGLATERYVDEYPCVVYTRTQEGGKTRNVMGVGISDVIREMRYHQAFLPTEKTYSWRAAIVSPDAVDVALSRMIMSKRNDYVVECIDFSSYDASINPDLSGRAFAFIASHFLPNYWDEIYDIYARFATIPFYTPDGEYQGNHGVPSGSAFTNTVDSIVQYLIIYETELVSGVDSIQIQGDDGILLIKGDSANDLIDAFTEAGLGVNVDKSERFSSQEGVYLQRYYHATYLGDISRLGGVYPIARALLRLKYLERFVDDVGPEKEITGDDYFVLRAISIIENCKYHPHFHDLIDFVRSRDKHALEYTKGSVKVYENRPDRRSRTEATNQYGDQQGIESFETVKYLRSR